MARMRLEEDVKPLSEFRSSVAACIRQVRTTKRPVVITHHGKTAAVLVGVTEYEALMQQMEVLEDLRVAEGQLAQGYGVAHDAALKGVLAKVPR